MNIYISLILSLLFFVSVQECRAGKNGFNNQSELEDNADKAVSTTKKKDL